MKWRVSVACDWAAWLKAFRRGICWQFHFDSIGGIADHGWSASGVEVLLAGPVALHERQLG